MVFKVVLAVFGIPQKLRRFPPLIYVSRVCVGCILWTQFVFWASVFVSRSGLILVQCVESGTIHLRPQSCRHIGYQLNLDTTDHLGGLNCIYWPWKFQVLHEVDAHCKVCYCVYNGRMFYVIKKYQVKLHTHDNSALYYQIFLFSYMYVVNLTVISAQNMLCWVVGKTTKEYSYGMVWALVQAVAWKDWAESHD
jgi:hypothetical protein